MPHSESDLGMGCTDPLLSPLSRLCRPVFKDASGTLDKSARFSALYRQDSSKLSDEDMFKLLTDFRK